MATKKSRDSRSSSSTPPAPAASARSKRPSARTDFPIVGVGASAGGLEAFTQLLQHLEPGTGMAFVLVQHLDPQHDSALVAILGRSSRLPVAEVKHLQPVKPDCVYIIPPGTALTIGKGRLLLRRRTTARVPHKPIDVFFESLARDRGGRAIGVVLSGTGSDGTLGLEAIKAEGGITIAQDDSAKYDAMPRSAVAAGCVDLVLAPAAAAVELMRIARHPVIGSESAALRAEVDSAEAVAHAHDETALPSGGHQRGPVVPPRGAAAEADAPPRDGTDGPTEAGYRKVLALLRGHSGVDFSLYKSPTIRRRISRRLVLTKQDTPDAYAAFLQENPPELDSLYSDVLISVTSFFRNPEVFELLQREVIPKLLRQEGSDPVRVWVLGCSTGQEAYSIAMSFIEANDEVSSQRKLQVFATDLNEALLEKARQGLYARSLAEDVSPTRLRRFFVEEDGGYRITKMLREMVVFARQNVISDPPFSRLDLVSCRNLLIYLEPVLQQKAIPTFHYALKPGGFLVLGASESVSGFTHLFEPLDRKHKVYLRKAGRTDARAFAMAKFAAPSDRASRPERSPRIPVLAPRGNDSNAPREADRITAQQFGPPAVLIDDDFQVLQFRGMTGAFLQPPSGKASFDVLKMARDGLQLPLRSALTQARKEGKAVLRENVRLPSNGSTRTIALQVLPLRNASEPCYLVFFLEAQAPRSAEPAPAPAATRLSAKAERSRIRDLENELAEQREYMQSIQEQSEAAQEELQASSEEVQSANEELQSVNEELETSKEELESANEELTTVNEEMSHRNAELGRVNSDLLNLQSSVRMAVLWVGRDLRLRSFSPQAEKQFHLNSSHLGQPLEHLQHRLAQVDPAGERSDALDLGKLASNALGDVRELELEVCSEEDRSFSLRVRPYVTLEGKIDGVVLVFVDVDEARRLEALIRESRDLADGAFAAVRHPSLVIDQDLVIERGNPAYYQVFRLDPDRTVGFRLDKVNGGCWNRPELLNLLQFSGERAVELRLQIEVPRIGRRTLLFAARRITEAGTERGRSMLVIEDITDRNAAEAARGQLAAIVSSCNDAIIGSNLRGEVTSWNEAAERLFGYGAVDIVGQPVATLLASDDPEQERQLEQRVRSGERIQHYETRGRRRDGSTFDAMMTISAVTDGEGRMMGTAKIVRDNSERSQMLEELRKNSEAMAELHQRKDEFLAMLSHELRSPLAAISSSAHLLCRVPIAEEVQQQAGEIIARQSGQLTRLVDDLLDVSRITTGHIDLARERVDPREIVRRALETVAPLMNQRRHTVETSWAPGSVFVLADPARLEQVVVNLLNNAAKYSEAGKGSIVVSVARQDRDVSISVKDTGEGIAPEMLPRVFDLFTQADRTLHRASGGLGLGLTLAQRLVQLHGGRIEAASQLGEGSEFTVWLPIEPDQRATVSEAVLEDEPASALRVLVVEDQADAARSLSMLLESYGHLVHTVDHGAAVRAAALELVPHVVLLDIGLPDMSGYDVARQLRAEERLRDVVLIALTGYGAREDKDRSRESGIDFHLIKPVDLTVLRRMLGTIRPSVES